MQIKTPHRRAAGNGREGIQGDKVMVPFRMWFKSRLHAACLSFMAGVMPPKAMLGR